MSLISKQIEELRAYAADRKGELAKIVSDAADTIEILSDKLSAANMERSSQYYNDGWIPVTERVPALREEVLATDGNYVWCANRVFYQDATLWEDLSSGWTIDGVTAWMPLPEPYKEGE